MGDTGSPPGPRRHRPRQGPTGACPVSSPLTPPVAASARRTARSTRQAERPAPCASRFTLRQPGFRNGGQGPGGGPPTCGQSGEHLQGLIVGTSGRVASNHDEKDGVLAAPCSPPARLPQGQAKCSEEWGGLREQTEPGAPTVAPPKALVSVHLIAHGLTKTLFSPK